MDSHNLLPWTLADIDFDRIESSQMQDNEDLFFLLASASFTESGSSLYTRNLLRYFDDDAEISGWLAAHWEPEELQHGRALRTYVARVWPQFDWDVAYGSFLAEYSAGCTVDDLEATKALEMASRCVVETGTAVYYRALQRCAGEPVLQDLCGRITSDEVGHYKHFLRYFKKHDAVEKTGRWSVSGALLRRVVNIRNDDMECAVRHVFIHRYPQDADNAARLRDLRARMWRLIRSNVHPPMALKMFLRPLDLPGPIERGAEYTLGKIAERLL